MEVTDSSDWPSLEMREFERKLRCPICQDFYRAAVMLRPCSHNFCSLCVRRALSVSGECPSCRVKASTADIEVNRILDELVVNFVVVRPIMISALKAPAPVLIEDDSHNSQISSSSQSQQGKRKSPRLEIVSLIEEPAPIPGDTTECPVCNTFVKDDKIEQHVDLCLRKGSSFSSSSSFTAFSSSKTQSKKPLMKRITKPVYNLLKDSDVKKLLVDLELPVTGDRETWVKRHSEFLMIYNAECDAPTPRSMSLLRSELRNLERSWNRTLPSINFGDNDEDFEQNSLEYRRRNAPHFDNLVDKIKQQSQQSKKKSNDNTT